ncbi:fimbria/pilus outer membrane usher protein [Acerihabitans sp. KWT182]|uniref:Fimbria/pilus outer membrane usher protein n=1 Tax=Acerihabitans sp. KWT182 TaxID=3157919 RepID=A0AAU7Q9I6_9GAMM
MYKLGRWGVANGAVTYSRMYGDNGGQYDWGYDYNNRYFSLGMRHTLRNGRFGNLTILDSGAHHLTDAFWSLNRRSGQYYASFSLEPYGSVGAAYIDIRTAAGEITRLWNASWSKTLGRESSLFIAATYDPRRRDCSGAVSLVVPFGARASASAGLERDRPGGTAQRLSVNRAMPSDGGLGWDLSYARQQRESDYRQATLNWRNTHLKTSAGLYGYGGNGTLWGDLAGALVLMDHHLLAADQLSNAFALVKTDYPDIPVRYENQPVGSTDAQGYLLVPGISAYYPAKYDIDTRALPLNMTAENVEQRVAVRRRSGYLLHFPIEPLRAANVILHDSQGRPLPAGSRILRDGQPIDYVGWDGSAWVNHLAAENLLRVVTPDGNRCTAHLTLPGGKPRPLQTYGPLTCPLSPSP